MFFRKKLPSLTALLALEATSRHKSVTAAARELGVTQAAISHHIAMLEEEFGRPLFIRGHRTLEPTPECLILGGSLAESFHNMADAIEVMRSQKGRIVTIGATIAFSSLWLVPRLLEFKAEHPDVVLRIISRNSRLALESGEFDLIFRYGSPPFPDGQVVASCPDVIFPVCSPAYAASHDLAAFPDCAFDLIEHDVPSRTWYRWTDWFAATGHKTHFDEPVLRFSYSTDAIAATLAGQGIFLGWEKLITQHLASGSLVKIGKDEVRTEETYNLVVPLDSRRSGDAALVAGWFARALNNTSAFGAPR